MIENQYVSFSLLYLFSFVWYCCSVLIWGDWSIGVWKKWWRVWVERKRQLAWLKASRGNWVPVWELMLSGSLCFEASSFEVLWSLDLCQEQLRPETYFWFYRIDHLSFRRVIFLAVPKSDIFCNCWALVWQWASDDIWTPMQTAECSRKKLEALKLGHPRLILGGFQLKCLITVTSALGIFIA